VRALALLVVGLGLAGCAAGTHPVYVKCTGKGTITGQSQVMVYGGSFVITADCGEKGFEYEGRQFRPKDGAVPAATSPPR